MDSRPIGVFDSGLGGLTAVKELKKILPCESIVYFGDTGRVPYGNRSRETIIKYAKQDADFLVKHDVKMIIAACGTVSSTIPHDFSQHFEVPFLTVIDPTAQAAVIASKSGRIGVIGTSATIRSGAYEKAVRRRNDQAEVFSKACPLFVHLVESGIIGRNNEIVRLTANLYLDELKHQNIDTLIMGCTHYPLIADVIADIMGEQVTLIDSGRETAHAASAILTSENMLSDSENPFIRYYVSDTADGFSELAGRFLGESVTDCVERVDIN